MQFFETDSERGAGPIVIGDQRALARAVRVGLPDANLARLRSMRSHAYFVILDLTMLRIAQQPRMDETEVGDVKEVFDHPRPFGAEEIWTRQHQAERGVITISKWGRSPTVLPQQTQTMP